MKICSIIKILFLGILSIVSASCNGQVVAPTDNRKNFGSTIAIGDTVSTMDKNIWYIFQDRINNFWFGSDGQGVYRYDGKTIIQFSTKHGLPNDSIRQIKEDNIGNVYFTTLDGICKFDGRKFTKLPLAPSNDPEKWILQPDDLWFYGDGQMKGPYRYDGKVLYSLKFPKHHLEDEYYKQYPNTTNNPYAIYCIYKDSKGAMWFGTAALGIYRFDGRSVTSMYEEHLTQIKNGGTFGIRAILEDTKGQFWFCNTKYRYNILPGELPAKGKGFINYSKGEGGAVAPGLLSHDRLYFQSIVEDSKGDIWMQTYQEGIWQYNGKDLTHYPIKDIKVISLYKDRFGDLWLGTAGYGVYKFSGSTFEKFMPLQ